MTDYWDYTLSPTNPQQLGNDLYLEYGDPNIWDLSMSSRCGMIQWTHKFSFYDLWNECKDSN